MKQHGILALTVVVLGGIGGWADPSYQGATGLFFAPTAEVTSLQGYSLGLFGDPGSLGHRNWYTFTYGIQEGLEVGLLKWNWDVGEGEATALGAKLEVLSRQNGALQIAAGINNITEEKGGWVHIGGSNQTQVYVVGSRALATSRWARRKGIPAVKGHFGIIGGTPESNFFLGLEVPVVQGFTLIAENYNEQSNVGARIHFNARLSAHLAFINLADPDTIIGVAFSEGF
jgi:hypothetical protein